MADQGSLFGPEKKKPTQSIAGKYYGESRLDAARAKIKRDEAMAQVENHAEDQWKVRAREAVLEVARSQDEFTADDVWARLDGTRENRALGPVMLAAARENLIRKTDRVRNTAQVSRHAAPVTIWRSLLRNAVQES